MAILITGGAGYIGSHTCVELLNAGRDIVVFDNFYNSSPEAVSRVKTITGRDFPFVEGDIRDRAALERLFSAHKIEAVIHFAGLKAVGESVEQPLKYFDNNVTGTIALCETMAKHGVKNMVFSSSATVYGAAQPPLSEEMPVGDVTNPYGRTKFMIEQILRDLCVSDPEWSVVLLRYFNPIGAHESGLIGEDPADIPNNLLPYVAQVAVGRLEVLPVFGDDYETEDGTCIRDYIHVVDLARGHLAGLDYAGGHKGCEVFNLGTGNGYSVLQIINAFSKACGHEVSYQIKPRRAGDAPSCFSDPRKAREILGFEARFGIARMCEDIWRWQSSNPDGYR